MEHVLLDELTSKRFLNNEDFIEKNEFKKFGTDLNKALVDYKHYIGTYINKELVCVSMVKQVGDREVEIHTYVLPEFKYSSSVILEGHKQLLFSVGVEKIFTLATPSVKNFLQKRLGFKTIEKVNDYYKMFVSK